LNNFMDEKIVNVTQRDVMSSVWTRAEATAVVLCVCRTAMATCLQEVKFDGLVTSFVDGPFGGGNINSIV